MDDKYDIGIVGGGQGAMWLQLEEPSLKEE